MEELFERTAMLFGEENINKIKNSYIAVFGIGGVGSFTCEALARCGVGKIDLIDKDTVSPTNLNRQLVALHSTIGKYKVDVMQERILDINPDAEINAIKSFFLPENSDDFDFSKYDYVVDAVDTVTAKIELVLCAQKTKTPIISCMGAGNKINPDMFEITDIYKTSVCPLAKVMRRELKKRGIRDVKVVYSEEEAITPIASPEETGRKQVPGSVAFVPSVVGLIIAGEVVRDLCM